MPEKAEIEKGQFLSDSQIEYLVGEDNQLSSNAEQTKRSRIRDRTVGAIGDLTTVTNLGRDDREKLFDFDKPDPIRPRTSAGPHGKWGYVGLDNNFNRLVQFFYKMFRENGVPREEILSELESAVEAAEFEFRHDLQRAERLEEHLRPIDVEADFEITTVGNVDLQSARERAKWNEELSGIEMKALVESGYAELQLDP